MSRPFPSFDLEMAADRLYDQFKAMSPAWAIAYVLLLGVRVLIAGLRLAEQKL